MFIKSRKVLLASSIALAIATASGAGAAETMSQEVTNARLETQIWTTYALNPYLRANDLKVSVLDGKATLSGTVDEGVEKDLAKQIALGVDGIKDVDNKIVVQADYTPRRSRQDAPMASRSTMQPLRQRSNRSCCGVPTPMACRRKLIRSWVRSR